MKRHLIPTLAAAVLGLLASSGFVAAQTYNVTDLGKGFTPRAVNDQGQVVAETSVGIVLWSSSKTVLLKSGYRDRAWAMNASGQVVGSYDTGVIDASGYPIYQAFVWTPNVANGDAGTFTDLNTTLPEGSGWFLTSAQDVNDAGKIVGTGDFTDANGTTYYGIDFLWEVDEELRQAGVARYGKLTSVPMGPSNNDNPTVLNNGASPEVVGTINTESFVWQRDTPKIPLGHLDVNATQAWDINDSGQVAGISSNKAFVWTPGGTNGVTSNPQMRNLQPTSGVQQSKAFAINNAGLAVGVAIYSTGGAYFGFASDRTNAWRDLNKVSIKPANWQLQMARGCNNRIVNGVPSAQIVVSGYVAVTTTTVVRKRKTTTTTNEPHGFLLTPQ